MEIFVGGVCRWGYCLESLGVCERVMVGFFFVDDVSLFCFFYLFRNILVLVGSIM